MVYGTRNRRLETAGTSFKVKGPEGQTVKRILLERPRYITTKELRKPAAVTDKIRRDFPDLQSFCRNSMKVGVRKLLVSQEVHVAVQKHWNPAYTASGAVAEEEDENVVNMMFLPLFLLDLSAACFLLVK